MAGIPLVAASEALQAAAGALFNWKVGLLIVTVLLAVWIYRPSASMYVAGSGV